MGRPEVVSRVADRVLRGLVAGVWPAGSLLPSSRRLASEFGVSFHTVMAALRRLAASGLLEIRERHSVRVPGDVRERARALLASQAGRGRHRRLAVLISEFWHPPQRNAFYGTLVAHIQQEAARRSESVEVVPLPLRQQVESVEHVLRGGYDAAVFLAFSAEYVASMTLLHENRFPVLVFNRRIPGYDFPTVTLDDYGASRRLVRHLAELGHRNVCIVASHDCHAEVTPQPVKGRGKTVGWMDALIEYGMLDHCVMPVYVPWDYEPGIYEGAFRMLLRSSDRPTAIVFGHNPLAKRFLTDPEFSALSVPDEISLATFEPTTNLPRARGRPPLTCIHIDPRRTAQCVLETVEKIIAGVPHPPTIRMPLEIDLTESIGRPPAAGDRLRQPSAAFAQQGQP